jgi:hypothetical protein
MQKLPAFMKKQARDIYASGGTYSGIALSMSVSKSTVSSWCFDLSEKRRMEKMQRTKERREAARKIRSERPRKPLKSFQCEHPYEAYRGYHKSSSDGRRRVHLVHHADKSVRFMLLSRYMFSVHAGRILARDETVDHIDGDKTNDSIANFQILSLRDNAIKHSGVRTPIECLICKKHHFLRGRTCGFECYKVYRSRLAKGVDISFA